MDGRTREARRPRRARVPTRPKPSGSSEGYGFSGGIKPLKRGHQAGRFDGKAPERRGKLERVFRSPGRSKALKGEAQECWELKEASQGEKS
jgi:hypothetical protein